MKYFYLLVALAFLSCKDGRKYHDSSSLEDKEYQNGLLGDILQFQDELNSEYKNPDKSPLPDRHRKNFEGLSFFAPDTSYVVEAKFVRTPEAVPFLMPTTSGEKSEEVVYGIVHFSLNGKEHQLEIYQNKKLMLEERYRNYLFLPFMDDTNGEETYGGGRYIDLTIPEGNSIVIDFNKAYNPYCAYNKKYSCPLVPGVNTLDTRVLAGVKDFKRDKK
ncbi:hypothetical protein GGR42_003002 [Saonia flava]|uniref:DUF1684 domain-containing protein n=1 Tax=Saonia flava TaxID=523696 RepID=A0A846QW12_9FLAO|nr:DUF1684 domain-containing protein [Saonia flava]NJB72511.1 hypothetical protein [Saonia flava]